jgi:hypothetical protein
MIKQSPFYFFNALLRQSKARFIFLSPCYGKAKPVLFFQCLAMAKQSPFYFFTPCYGKAKPVLFFYRLATAKQSPFYFFTALLRQSKARFIFPMPCADCANRSPNFEDVNGQFGISFLFLR